MHSGSPPMARSGASIWLKSDFVAAHMKTRHKRDRCIDKMARSVWFLEVLSNVIRGCEPTLSEGSQQHLAKCEDCAASMSAVIERQRAAPELIKVSQMVGKAQRDDATVLKRFFESGIALFEVVEGDLIGRFAFVDKEYKNLIRDRMSRVEFETWQP
jgi:hypothetical protein